MLGKVTREKNFRVYYKSLIFLGVCMESVTTQFVIVEKPYRLLERARKKVDSSAKNCTEGEKVQTRVWNQS